LPRPITISNVQLIVVEEATTCFLAKPSLLDVCAEQSAGTFRVPIRCRVVFLDVQHDVQSDLFHESNRLCVPKTPSELLT
jgi:hypothetical protein